MRARHIVFSIVITLAPICSVAAMEEAPAEEGAPSAARSVSFVPGDLLEELGQREDELGARLAQTLEARGDAILARAFAQLAERSGAAAFAAGTDGARGSCSQVRAALPECAVLAGRP